ncbi:hypothetical protein [Saccharopolyspora erythraea]|uniref:Uncharacterized protein n=1 Tax=Saccharopolyspora erythraea TaxID=1836 RepID=A0ABP3MYH9_SACER|nr:hypothetical protein [Saccharopolyspora erythraea]QRK90802.1 hypothetical protein JQX30_04820 [Saccharopolyspora erythraea]
MHVHSTPDGPHKDRIGSDSEPTLHIPSPRPAPDDNVAKLPQISCDQAVWWYDQELQRGDTRRFSGYVNAIGGTEGDRLREELVAVIRDLLEWATCRRGSSENPSEDGKN